MEDAEIVTFVKNKREEVRVSLTTYKGAKLLNMRSWLKVRPEDEFRPTRKGLTIRIGQIETLRDALNKALELIEGEEDGEK